MQVTGSSIARFEDRGAALELKCGDRRVQLIRKNESEYTMERASAPEQGENNIRRYAMKT
jgi:hypothetical protein